MNRKLCAACHESLDLGVTVVRGGKFRAAPGVSTPPAPRPAGPLFYSGMVVGTLLSGLAFTWRTTPCPSSSPLPAPRSSTRA